MVCFGPRSACLRGFFVLLAALMSGLTWPGTGWGQEPPTFELPEVVVPGRRPQPAAATPAAVSVLTRRDLQRLGFLTIGEVLQFVSDVHMRLQGGLGALSLASIRGSSPAQVLVLIDGVPVNSAMLGLFDLSTVSVAQVERVEILRGPFSALYGSGALGGVISITTRAAAGSALNMRAGSLGTTSIESRWLRSGSPVLSLSVDRFASIGARPNSDVTSLTVAGRLDHGTPGAPSSTITVNHFRSEVGIPGSTAFPSPLARQREVRTILSARGTRSDAAGTWHWQAYGWVDDFQFIDPAFATDSRIATTVLGGTVQRVREVRAGRVRTFGAEWQTQSLQHNGAVGSRSALLGALYVQEDRQLAPRTLLSAGLRYDLHSIYGAQLNPRLGVVHVVRDGLTLRAAVGRTFRGPTFSELFFTPFNNPALRPESAWAAEAGITWRMGASAEMRATAFITAAVDLIRPDVTFVPQNIGRAMITGISVEAAGTLSARLVGSAHVAVVRATDAGTGTQLLRVPWVTAAAALHYRLYGGMLSGLVTYVGTRPDSDPATFAPVMLPAYTVVGLRYTRTTTAGQWQLAVDNLLDTPTTPIAGFPAPGRTVLLTFSRQF